MTMESIVNITGKLFPLSMPRIAIQGGGLVTLLAFVHTVSDAITNMLSALLPIIQSRYGLAETSLRSLCAALSSSARVTKPLFGAVADQIAPRRIAGLGVIFNAILFSRIGIVPNVFLLFGLILIGGLGSAALHPAMASMARLAGRKKGELAVGLFSAGRTIGIAVGPIMIMLLLANLGLSFTPWLMIPGILLGTFMLFAAPEEIQSASGEARKRFARRAWTRTLPPFRKGFASISVNYYLPKEMSNVRTFHPSIERERFESVRQKKSTVLDVLDHVCASVVHHDSTGAVFPGDLVCTATRNP
jgi:MFS family permease